MAGMFIEVTVDAKTAGDRDLAKKLDEVCPVSIFDSSGETLRIALPVWVLDSVGNAKYERGKTQFRQHAAGSIDQRELSCGKRAPSFQRGGRIAGEARDQPTGCSRACDPRCR